MTDPIRAAIYSKLTGDAELVALLAAATNAFHQVAPLGAELPYIVFNRQTGSPDRQFQGGVVQHDIWLVKGVAVGPSAATAEALAARIDAVLDGAELPVSARAVLAVFRMSDVTYPEVDGIDVYQHEGALYRVITQPA